MNEKIALEVDDDVYDYLEAESNRLSTINEKDITPETIVELVVKYYADNVMEVRP